MFESSKMFSAREKRRWAELGREFDLVGSGDDLLDFLRRRSEFLCDVIDRLNRHSDDDELGHLRHAMAGVLFRMARNDLAMANHIVTERMHDAEFKSGD